MLCYQMYEFTRTCWNGIKVGKTTKIQLVATKKAGAEVYILMNFYGSAVINFISWDAICCVFPRTTVHERRMQVLWKRQRTERVDAAILKYERRGFETVEWDDMNMEKKEFSEARGMRDRMCWNVPLRKVGSGNCTGSSDKKRKRQEKEHSKSTKTRRCIRFAMGRRRVLFLRSKQVRERVPTKRRRKLANMNARSQIGKGAHYNNFCLILKRGSRASWGVTCWMILNVMK